MALAIPIPGAMDINGENGENGENGDDFGYESAISQSPHSDCNHSDADIEDEPVAAGKKARKYRMKQNDTPKPKLNPEQKRQPCKKRTAAAAATAAADADAAASTATEPATKRSRSKKKAITPADRRILDVLGDTCDFSDSLLALGTKELNTVLRKGVYTPAQVEELKAARRRAKNRTYALRSRQKRDGKGLAPTPGSAAGMAIVAKTMAAEAAELASAAASQKELEQKKAARRLAKAAAAAAAAKQAAAVAHPPTPTHPHPHTHTVPKKTPTTKGAAKATKPSSAKKHNHKTSLAKKAISKAVSSIVSTASAIVGSPGPAELVADAAPELTWDAVQRLLPGTGASSVASSTASGSWCTNSETDIDVDCSDTESFSSFQSSLDWSSEASGWSSQYDSESNDSEASVGFEFASMTLDPNFHHHHHHAHRRHHDSLPQQQQQQQQQQACGTAPHSEVVWLGGPPPSPSSLPASQAPVRQATELEAMMAELAGLKSDYHAVHNKLDQLASNIGPSTGARLEDGSVGIPAVDVQGQGRRSRCGTPTPADGDGVVAGHAAAGTLSQAFQTGFESLSARIPWMPDEEVDDTWLEKVDSGISSASITMAMDLAPGGGSSVDHFTRAMLGMF